MTDLPRDFDRDGLLEYSVVFTDRSLNHMSQTFQQVMRDISSTLKGVYNANAVAVVPGGGTFGMEAVARQFAQDKKCLVIRNGWFSYRWSQIFEMGRIPASETVLKASKSDASSQPEFAPAAIADVVAEIRANKPEVVFAPHVETAAGIILPDDYLRAVADAVHEVGGLFVLDWFFASSSCNADRFATLTTDDFYNMTEDFRENLGVSRPMLSPCYPLSPLPSPPAETTGPRVAQSARPSARCCGGTRTRGPSTSLATPIGASG